MNDRLDLIGLEFIFGLNFVMKASSTQKFKDNVKRVFWFKDLKEPHVVWMGKVSHNFNFFDEALFSFLFTVSCFFGEGFNCVLAFILVLFYEIDGSEVSFSDFV